MNSRINALQLFNVRALLGAKTIAVVGNAGINYEDNQYINQADVVVRFNNYATRKDIQYTNDRFRCDVLFSTFDLHSAESDPRVVVIGIPYPFNLQHIPRKLNKWYPKSVPYMVNPYLNAQICAELGLESDGYKHPLPSIGFTALWNIHNVLKTVINYNPVIYVAGFRWYSDPSKLTIQDRHVHLPKASHFNHHYREEMQWIIRHLLHDTHYFFSKECRSILETFEPHLK